jgi:hypothetical protein
MSAGERSSGTVHNLRSCLGHIAWQGRSSRTAGGGVVSGSVDGDPLSSLVRAGRGRSVAPRRVACSTLTQSLEQPCLPSTEEGCVLAGDVAILGAVAGRVPAGKSDLNPKLNAIQTLVAKRENGGWRILQFQNTPAQFHGRPEDAEALTNKLRALI